ncbi:caspase family protein [Treponema sp. R80B11-R83G3]
MKKTLFLLLFVAFCWNIAAQQGGDLEFTTSNKYALVIGNANYSYWGKLKNPINDAEDMREALASMGYNVIYLLDVNLDQMKNAVITLQRRLASSKDAFGVFYFSGHGGQNNSQDYLIPVNAYTPDRGMLPDKALSLEYVLDSLKEANNALNVLILDSCRDHPWKSSLRGLVIEQHYAAGTIIVYAAEPGKTSDDAPNERNGRFTGQLLRHIKTRGLDINELFRKTGEGVRQKTNEMQVPVITTSFHGIASIDGTRPNSTPPPQPYNPLVGSWSSSMKSNDETLTCNLSFWPDGTVTVGRYDTNIMTKKVPLGLWYYHTNDIKSGSGKGTYKIRENGNIIYIDIVLYISGVSRNFTDIRAEGKLNKNNPNQFTVKMKCEYKYGYVSDYYEVFTKM